MQRWAIGIAVAAAALLLALFVFSNLGDESGGPHHAPMSSILRPRPAGKLTVAAPAVRSAATDADTDAPPATLGGINREVITANVTAKKWWQLHTTFKRLMPDHPEFKPLMEQVDAMHATVRTYRDHPQGGDWKALEAQQRELVDTLMKSSAGNDSQAAVMDIVAALDGYDHPPEKP